MIKVSVIGAGYMAREHIAAFQSFLNVKITGIYSRTFERAAALASQFEINEICNSVDSLFEKTKADLVIIAVPELFVREVCEQAFKYPWICLIEKPAGYNLLDAENIVLAAQKNQSKAYVAFNRRHYSSTKIVLADLKIQTGQRMINVYDQQDQIQAKLDGQPDLVIKNWMYANSIHLIDYFTFLGQGEITSVETILEWDAENPSYIVAKLTYSSGDLGLYQAVWNRPGPWAVTVTTKEKRWELRPLELAGYQQYGCRKLQSIESHANDLKFKPGLFSQAEEAVKAVCGLSHTLPSLADSLVTMRLVKKIYNVDG